MVSLFFGGTPGPASAPEASWSPAPRRFARCLGASGGAPRWRSPWGSWPSSALDRNLGRGGHFGLVCAITLGQGCGIKGLIPTSVIITRESPDLLEALLLYHRGGHFPQPYSW